MLKRKKGRLLLTLLVITGLAGTLKDVTISNKERKSAVNLMRDSRTEVINSIKDLSEGQLNFKPTSDHLSIKEAVYHMAISEKNLWHMMENSIKKAATPERRDEIKITDNELINAIENGTNKITTFELSDPKTKFYKSIDDALNAFKNNRSNHIKYIKSTTEDLRNHIIQMPFGPIDCYQLCLMIALNSNLYLQQISEVKDDPGFPKK